MVAVLGMSLQNVRNVPQRDVQARRSVRNQDQLKGGVCKVKINSGQRDVR